MNEIGRNYFLLIGFDLPWRWSAIFGYVKSVSVNTGGGGGGGGVKIGHMKNALFGVLTIAMYTTLKSAFFILPGYLKNALFDVVNIEIVKAPKSAFFI